MQWNLPEVQSAQRAEAKYLLGITDEVVETPADPETPDTEPEETPDGDD